LDSLNDTKPDWVIGAVLNGKKLSFQAQLTRGGGERTRLFHIEIRTRRGRVVVSEQKQNSSLPSFCPDRHINDDSSFCVGYEAGHQIDDEISARSWWDQLAVFLLAQETAEESRTWPSYAFISHGDSGKAQLKAESAARSLGQEGIYSDALRYNRGPIMLLLKLVNVKEQRLINGRAPCVCGRKEAAGQILLRRKCHKLKLACIPVLEVQRRLEELRYWKGMSKKQMACCGSMRDCPLQSEDAWNRYTKSIKHIIRGL